ncbi:MAG: NfeD family protein [Planctomycetota bacterium]
MPSLYSIVLLVLFYALLVAEIFVPSGGLLGISAVLAGLAAVVVGLTHSFTFGMTVLLIVLVTTPILLTLIIRIWPRTGVGRQILNLPPGSTAVTRPVATTMDGMPLTQWVGRDGVATTDCLPAGEVRVDGHRSNAVSTGQPIDEGTAIRVVRIVSGRVHVRPLTEDELEARRTSERKLLEPGHTTPGAPVIPESTGKVTGTSLDDLDLDEISP